jgi:hypothetical protein
LGSLSMSTFAKTYSMPAADHRPCASWSVEGLRGRRSSNIVLGLGIALKQETQAFTNPHKAFIA